jgi:hypothetical protein
MHLYKYYITCFYAFIYYFIRPFLAAKIPKYLSSLNSLQNWKYADQNILRCEHLDFKQ